MMLSDRDLREALDNGALVICPSPADEAIQPASIDLTLGDTFARLAAPAHPFPEYIDLSGSDLPEWETETVAPGDRWALAPGAFCLATTVETVHLGPDLVGILAGKSSLARLGLAIEAAGLVDPGFTGQLTCELFNQTDRVLMLAPGMAIAQLMVHQLSSPCEIPYGDPRRTSRYQGQTGPTPARSLPQRRGGGTSRRR